MRMDQIDRNFGARARTAYFTHNFGSIKLVIQILTSEWLSTLVARISKYVSFTRACALGDNDLLSGCGARLFARCDANPPSRCKFEAANNGMLVAIVSDRSSVRSLSFSFNFEPSCLHFQNPPILCD